MLVEAYRDLKYLLDRGYRKSVALNFVANHYRLRKEERYLLARCVFSSEWIKEVQKKILKPRQVYGRVLGIDGFNVLITLESLLAGKAILCEDSLVRDLEYLRRYRPHENTAETVELMVLALRRLRPKKVIVFYGRNTPKSGIVKALTLGKFKELGIEGRVELVKSPDLELKRFNLVATADVGIISSVENVFDLARFAGRIMGAEPVSILKLLKKS